MILVFAQTPGHVASIGCRSQFWFQPLSVSEWQFVPLVPCLWDPWKFCHGKVLHARILGFVCIWGFNVQGKNGSHSSGGAQLYVFLGIGIGGPVHSHCAVWGAAHIHIGLQSGVFRSSNTDVASSTCLAGCWIRMSFVFANSPVWTPAPCASTPLLSILACLDTPALPQFPPHRNPDAWDVVGTVLGSLQEAFTIFFWAGQRQAAI